MNGWRLGGGFSGYRPVLRDSLDRRYLWPPITTGTHTLRPSRLRVGMYQTRRLVPLDWLTQRSPKDGSPAASEAPA